MGSTWAGVWAAKSAVLAVGGDAIPRGMGEKVVIAFQCPQLALLYASSTSSYNRLFFRSFFLSGVGFMSVLGMFLTS